MAQLPPNISIQEIEVLAKHDKFLSLMLDRIFATTFESFVKTLYEDLDIAIAELELNPQLMQGDYEDKLSAFLISLLKRAGYNASLGSTGGGNKDLTVIGRDPSWSWIGEAKKYHSITNLHEAFLQLATRYRNVNPTKPCGGILAYIFRPDAKGLMAEWREKLPYTKTVLNELTTYPCKKKPKLAFFSRHNHVASGLPFEVRHIGIVLYHNPEDRSGRTRKGGRCKTMPSSGST